MSIEAGRIFVYFREGQVVLSLNWSEMKSAMASDPLIGMKLGDYEIRRLLGQGGMARVYLGHDSLLQRNAAVKVADPHFVRDDEREEYRERFLREARAIARLHHPNIVGVYQFGQANGLYYMAMVFVEGRDLRHILKDHADAGTRMAPAEILRIVTDVADALDYAHQAGVVHRDVKPSNIMVCEDGHAVLTDFGLVLNVPEGTIGMTFGSVHYIAPEQVESSRMAVPQSDLYGLGVVLYEMLTGRVPFNDTSIMGVALKQLNEAPPPPSVFNPGISPAVEAVVLKALAKDPEKRYPTGAALVAALERALGITDDDEHTRPLPLLQATPPVPDESELETPTLVEPNLSPPTPPTRQPAARAGRIGASALALVLLAGGAIVGGALLGAGGPASDAAPTAVDTAAQTALATATAQPTRGASATPVLTHTPIAAVARSPASTLATPAQTGASPPAAAPPADVRLLYNDQGLTLLNVAAEPVDVSGLTFVQRQADGNALVFRASMWSSGAVSPEALPPGGCFQVWSDELPGKLELPTACGSRYAWSRVAFPRWFWIGNAPGAVFTVERDGRPLAECLIAAGACSFSLD
ncbi:MAG: protein kinase domain-containing protein [Aggregatilineales bacterium]